MGRDERNNLRGLPGGLPIIGAGGGRILDQPAVVLDALGREIAVGDVIVFTVADVKGYTVTQIAPAPPEPDQPAGLLDMDVICRLRVRTVRAQPAQEFLRILQKAERPDQTPPLVEGAAS